MNNKNLLTVLECTWCEKEAVYRSKVPITCNCGCSTIYEYACQQHMGEFRDIKWTLLVDEEKHQDSQDRVQFL